MLLSNVIVAEIICQHIFDCSPVVVSMDDDQLEGYTNGIYDVVDEAMCLIAFHSMYISYDFDMFGAKLSDLKSADFLLCENHLKPVVYHENLLLNAVFCLQQGV